MREAHLIENEVLVATNSDDPNFAWTIGNPIKIRGEKRKLANDPPAFGEHTIEILKDLGFNEAQIDTLVQDKIVFTSDSS